MPVETLGEIDELPDLVVEPVPIKEINDDNMNYFYNLAEEKTNYFNTIEKFNNFFINNFKNKSSELVFTADCKIQLIPYLRKLVTEQLAEHGIISNEEKEDFYALTGEVIRDTLHSTEQQFDEPKFTVRMTNLDHPEKLTFDIINPDKIPCQAWLRKEARKRGQEITGDEKEGGPVGLGTSMLPVFVKLLGGEAYYADIKDENGQKQYTIFRFEKRPEQNEDRKQYIEDVKKRSEIIGH